MSLRTAARVTQPATAVPVRLGAGGTADWATGDPAFCKVMQQDWLRHALRSTTPCWQTAHTSKVNG